MIRSGHWRAQGVVYYNTSHENQAPLVGGHLWLSNKPEHVVFRTQGHVLRFEARDVLGLREQPSSIAISVYLT